MVATMIEVLPLGQVLGFLIILNPMCPRGLAPRVGEDPTLAASGAGVPAGSSLHPEACLVVGQQANLAVCGGSWEQPAAEPGLCE